MDSGLGGLGRSARAERRARAFGIAPRIYADYAQVLDDPAVDAVELLTPTNLHAEQIVAGLAAASTLVSEADLGERGRGRSDRRGRGEHADDVPRDRELSLGTRLDSARAGRPVQIFARRVPRCVTR